MSSVPASRGSSTRTGPSRGATSPHGDPASALVYGKPRIGERIAILGLSGSALLSVVVTIAIFVSLLLPALAFFGEVNVVDFLTGTRWAPTFADATYGVLPLVTGTLWTTAIGLTIAVPFGLGAAVYLAEYAHERTRRILKPVLEVLAGIPSVVYGYFALYFVTPVVL